MISRNSLLCLLGLLMIGLLSGCMSSKSKGPSAEDKVKAERWLQYYYVTPTPDRLPKELSTMQAAGIFQSPEKTFVIMGFVTRVFANHPTKIPTWVKTIETFSPGEQQFFWAALRYSETKQGQAYLESVKTKFPSAAPGITNLLRRPSPDLEALQFQTPHQVDMAWGSFFATGQVKYLHPIVRTATLPVQGKVQEKLRRNTQFTLMTMAAHHPRIVRALESYRDLEAIGPQKGMIDQMLNAVKRY